MAPTTAPGSGAQPNDNQKFFRYFQHEVTDIQDRMTHLEDTSTSGGERSDAVDHLSAAITRLSNEVLDAASSLPTYDQRTYSEAIKALSAKLQQIRTNFAPRAKFAFKKGTTFQAKKNPSAISLNDAAELAREGRKGMPGLAGNGRPVDSDASSSFATTPLEPRSPAPELQSTNQGTSDPDATTGSSNQSKPKAVKIENHTALHIILPRVPTANAPSTAVLSNLTRCVVDMSQPRTTLPQPSGTDPVNTTHNHPGQIPTFETLTLRDISSSLLVLPRVRGAVHASNLTHTILIVVGAGQFRLHASRDCTVYLSTTSKPVIEHCSNIGFAPLPAAYGGPGVETEERDALWREVQDFDDPGSMGGPRAGGNWSILGEDKRLDNRVWEAVVPGGPGVGVQDVLKAVGVGGLSASLGLGLG